MKNFSKTNGPNEVANMQATLDKAPIVQYNYVLENGQDLENTNMIYGHKTSEYIRVNPIDNFDESGSVYRAVFHVVDLPLVGGTSIILGTFSPKIDFVIKTSYLYGDEQGYYPSSTSNNGHYCAVWVDKWNHLCAYADASFTAEIVAVIDYIPIL